MDALRFYLVETAADAGALDLGQVAPSSSADTILRIHNTSDLYQAQDVTVTVANTGDSLQLWLSDDGDTFGDSLALGAVPPGGYSPTFWLRRVTAAAATGSCTGALSVAASLWSDPVDISTSDNVPLPTED